MAKLSKSSIYAIKYLFTQGLNAEQISQEINLSIDNINAIIESEGLVQQSPSAKDLMINKTAVKRTNSVSIMTQEASMMNDHNRTKYSQNTPSKPEHIFKPFEK